MKAISSYYNEADKKPGLLFKVFCLWTFVLLCRPQDIIISLAELRLALVIFVVILSIAMLQFRNLNEPEFLRERQVKYYLTLVFIMIFGIPFSLYPRLSFIEFFTKQISIVGFFFLFYKVVNSAKRLYFVLFVTCLSTGIYAGFSILTGEIEHGRLFFGNNFDPNDLAYFALAFLPFNLFFILHKNPLWLRLICCCSLCVETLLIFLAGSRGGLLAFIVISLWFLFGKTHIVKFRGKMILLALVIGIICNTSLNYNRYATLFNIGNDYNVQSETGRFAIWGIGVRAMLSNPFTGVGFRCFGNAVGLDREKRNLENTRWQAAHNSVVLIGTETGIIGLVLFLLISFNVFRIFGSLKKKYNSQKMAKFCEVGQIGFVGLFIAGFFLSQAYSLYWAFYVSISAVVNQLYLCENRKTFA